MFGPVRYEIEGGVAIIVVDNPPVNALSATVREGLADGLRRAGADEAVRAVVLIGERVFIAGADITEFGKPNRGPSLHSIFDLIETSKKPVVAALAGAALGEGLEAAMACHYRVAAPDASVGLPEVNLGLLPGAGGTQRLPRLVGPQVALDIILTGQPISARRAVELGIIDQLVDGDLRAGVIDFAKDKVNLGHEPPVASLISEKVTDIDMSIFDAVREKNRAKWRGQVAPWKIVDCVEAACTLSFDKGLRLEQTAFAECMQSPAREALIHIFFAERAAAKISGVGQEVKPLRIRTAAVVGAGTMGGGIAMALANAGISVKILDISPEMLARGKGMIEKNYATSVARGSMNQSTADQALGLIDPVGAYGAIRDADIVIEAAFENMDLKKEIFATLDETMKVGAILATNTSSLDIDEIASATKRPQDVVGTHFFSPANIMRLQENVRGARSSPTTLATVMALAKQLNKVPVLAGNCDGFIGNRILAVYGREADFLLEEGASPEEIDGALMAFGFPMGVYRMRDMSGLDVGWRIRQHRAPTRNKLLRYSRVADVLCEEGRFGQKTGAGYYRYALGDRTPLPDLYVDELVARIAAEDGVPRHPAAAPEIVNRILCAMVNEGAKIVGEGVAIRASDIDVTYVYGYGFPKYRGGPMFWAEQRGLREVFTDVLRYHAVHGALWRPAPLLAERAAQGGGWDGSKAGGA